MFGQIGDDVLRNLTLKSNINTNQNQKYSKTVKLA